VCAIDVGRVVNPLGVEAQMMGGTIDAISTALNLAITVKEGQVQQRNFTDYTLMRMAQAPQEVEVYIVPSRAERSARAGERNLRGHHGAHSQAADDAGVDAAAVSVGRSPRAQVRSAEAV